ncbi:hypothetical protein SDC9_194060 [bioreactor metagenome]|uniref:Uncharacterized protein n=1 Tax=bioreactor metagenome TaxID=1076179 RepID=A0A645IDW0_9ZZZZ
MIQQLGYFLGGFLPAFVLRRHPDLAGLFNHFFADEMLALGQLPDRTRFGVRLGDFGLQFGKQRFKTFHALS